MKHVYFALDLHFGTTLRTLQIQLIITDEDVALMHTHLQIFQSFTHACVRVRGEYIRGIVLVGKLLRENVGRKYSYKCSGVKCSRYNC